jgi:heme-degrading monooxygenase HmoA
MFRHVAAITFKPNVTTDQVDAMAEALRAIRTPGMISITCGRDAGYRGSAEFAVVGDFESLDAYRQFSDSAAHQAYREDHSSRLVDKAVVVQYEF